MSVNIEKSKKRGFKLCFYFSIVCMYFYPLTGAIIALTLGAFLMGVFSGFLAIKNPR